MAHKTNSKEQFKFQVNTFVYTFNTFFMDKQHLNTVNAAVLFFLLSKKNFPKIETNIFFLKNYKLIYNFNDILFFKI
jgi:hypothetical protein